VWHSAAALFPPRPAAIFSSARSFLDEILAELQAKLSRREECSRIRVSRFGALNQAHQAAFLPGLTGFSVRRESRFPLTG
jgi:hypothetical protein